MQIGNQVLFKGYVSNPADYEPALAPGDACIIEKVDGDTGFTVRKIPGGPARTSTEWVLAEEVMPPGPTRPPGDPRPDPRQVFRTMARENTKKFADLRDRVAYMYVTGAHPTHLRPFFTAALNVLSRPCAASGRFGPLLIDRSAVYTLGLNRHPMVVEARRLLSERWQLVVSLGPNERRSHTTLFFSREQHRLTLSSEGWTKPGWPQDWGPRRSTRH